MTTQADRALDRIHDYYCTPRPVGDVDRSIYEIWEHGEAFNDSITPSTYVPEYRTHIGDKILALSEPGTTVFSLGCGNGFVEGDLVVSGRDVRAIDLNDEAVQLTRNKGVDAYTADFFALPPADVAGSAVVYADGLLGHLFDPELRLEPAFAKLVALDLAPGTYLVFSNDSPHDSEAEYAPHERVEGFWFVSKEHLDRCLAEYGFEVVESYYFPYLRPISGPRNRTICVARVPWELTVPLSEDFADRLLPLLPDVVADYGTPFHVYDARGIVATHRAMERAFAGTPFRQYFAVKALPNPAVLSLLYAAGSGLDCSSPVEEPALAAGVGARGDDVVYTSNNTSLSEYRAALDAGALVTFDDRSFLDKADPLPDVVAFRVSPYGLAAGSALMGDPAHSKFGVPAGELPAAYRAARARGATRFGIHGMTCANELDTKRAIRAAVDLVELAARVAADAGIELEYVNLGGGLGIPYRPEERPLDFAAYADAIVTARDLVFGPGGPRVLMECGRYVTGPHGVLVTRVINRCRKGHDVVGLDASMPALMRPAMYGAYHHVSLPFATGRPEGRYDVVGSLCENMDKFAVDRVLPEPREDDVVLVHDTGAHGHAMGFTYNGRLRPAELLLTETGDLVEIRRAETYDDYVATVRARPVPVRTGGA